MPSDPTEEARCIGTMCWFSSVVHPSYQRTHRPERFAEGEAAAAAVKENGKKTFWANLQEIDSMIQGNDWVMGRDFTAVDGYALVFYGWAQPQRISGERPQGLHGLARAHDEAPDS